MTEMCGAIYRRDQAHVIQCTFIKGHESKSNHSWFALQIQDQVDAEARTVEVNLPMQVPKSVVPLVEIITSGGLDAHLEVILAACHGRKRARHATRRGEGR
jgi:hypothetical protein